MQIDQLTQNGIEKLLKGETVTVQIIGVTIVPLEKKGQNLEIIKAIISDGFAFYQSAYIHSQYFPNNNVNFNVIKIKLSEGQFKKLQRGTHKQDNPLVTETSSLIVVTNNVKKKIGNPISYDEFVKKGRKNPKGNRKIFDNDNHKQEQDQYDTEDDLFNEVEKLKNINRKQKQVSNSKQIQNKTENTKNINANVTQNPNANANKNKNLIVKKEQDNSTSRSNSVTNNTHKSLQPQKKNNQVSKPIVKIEKSQKEQPNRNSIKPQVKHHEGDHQTIKQLFLGIQSFRLLARLIFIMPVKSYTTKKGVQSQLLNMQFGDATGTIQCTVFGDNASRYSTLEVDKIYSISGATVTQAQYQGHTQLKLNFNDSTCVKIIQDNKTAIPTVDKFCLSLKQLNETDKGKVVAVKCLIKQGDLVEFVSKKGNNMKKKMLRLYDLDNQIQSQIAVFNENAQMQYIQGMYALKGVEVDEFQGKKQFKAGFSFFPRFLKGHIMNKRIKEVQQVTFTSIASNQKSKKQSINSFSDLNEKSGNLQLGQNLWSQVICYVKSIRANGTKNVYLSCPHCRKKITDQSATQCHNCKKDFERPVYRYLLTVNLMDDHDNIWAGAYDEGEKILNTVHQEKFLADNFATMSDDDIKQRIQQIRYKQIKTKIVSSKEEYQGELRVKHKIVKVLPIDFAQQSKSLLQRIKAITSTL